MDNVLEIMSNAENPKGITDITKKVKGKSKVIGKRGMLSGFAKKARMDNKGIQHNPLMPGAADYIQGYEWDRATFSATTTLPTQFNFFQIPQGTGGKTKSDTSLTQAGQLAAPQWINVVNISLYLASTMQLVDIHAYMNQYWIEFWVQDKIYADGLPWLFPQMGGMQGVQTFAAAATNTFYTNGVPQTFNGYDVRLPQGMAIGQTIMDGITGITINSGQNFKLVNQTGYTPPTLAAASGIYGGFNVMAILQGVISRQVQ